VCLLSSWGIRSTLTHAAALGYSEINGGEMNRDNGAMYTLSAPHPSMLSEKVPNRADFSPNEIASRQQLPYQLGITGEAVADR
jgi:hypothetical protein